MVVAGEHPVPTPSVYQRLDSVDDHRLALILIAPLVLLMPRHFNMDKVSFKELGRSIMDSRSEVECLIGFAI